MKNLKLELGKTYVNRKGNEVKIVRKDNTDRYSYQGSDLEWYAKNGRFYLSKDSAFDLIEEIPETSHTFAIVPEALTATQYTFTIPDGKEINVSKEGNRVVVEIVLGKEPKPGDVLVNEHKGVYIFKSDAGYGNHNYYAWVGKSGRLSFEWTCAPGRPATAEEAQPLWDALKKSGKRWNPETMQVEDVPETDAAEREKIMDFLKDYGLNIPWTHEQLCWLIEGYLKHKEGEQ